MTSPSRIERVQGRALAIAGDDIDTDRIIPARFLKAVTFDGLEAHVFEDDRKEAAGKGARHPFDEPASKDAAVLLVNANFGCGSSREHAPQALWRRGIRAIVGESFAEIFFGNALMMGLPCFSAARADIARLMDVAGTSPGVEFVVDVPAGRVTAGALTVPVSMPQTAKDALVSGAWDATGALVQDYEVVERVASRIPYLRGF
jgi:3-isopropylmalate/(R)-2-methylmalate dehydratase small subunit